MYLKQVYEIPSVIEDLDEVNILLSDYENFIDKLNVSCSDLDFGISWFKDTKCSYFSNEIQSSIPPIGSVKNLKVDASIDSVKIEFKIFNINPNYESEYTQGHTVVIPINKIALVSTNYLLVSLLDRNCCWLFKYDKLNGKPEA
jgi:hypothetical protein